MKLPQTPYWAVIFSNQRTSVDPKGYAAMAARMVELACQQPGCLGFKSARDAEGFGITVSYWESLESIQGWRDHPEHKAAQALGREQWYADYSLQISRVERAYDFQAASQKKP